MTHVVTCLQFENQVETIVLGAFLRKRIFDFTFSLFVIVFILTWLIPILALLIKLDSRGPVFFKQLRTGRHNRPFYCLKFRSMRLNSEADRRQATKGDSRVTGIGAFMRRTSIDELPQFINVLLGEMSVVGPRPHMLQHTETYSKVVENFMVRHSVPPGITGWAQVTGYRGETTDPAAMVNRVQADIWYIKNWSFLLDLKIVLMTSFQFLRGSSNAY